MSRIPAVLVGMALLAAACGPGAGNASGSTEPKTLTVFAAASLTESFGALKKEFEAQHAGVDIRISFEGSSALVQKLANGARADVFASADQATMDNAVRSGVIDGRSTVFATNKLAIAVAKGNPKGIKSFTDLAAGGLIVILCAPQVPCGSATQQVEKNTGVTLKPASEEQDVKAVLAKVQSGDADAGLVYLTDVTAANSDKVDRVDFPESSTAINDYPIAVVAGAPQAELAKEFTDFVLSDAGRQVLSRVGFGPP